MLFQITCIRLLECLPVVLQRLQQSMHKIPGDSDIVVKNSISYKWVNDLTYWGKSTLVVVVRYWKQAMVSLLELLKDLCDDKTYAILAIEKLIQCGMFLLNLLWFMCFPIVFIRQQIKFMFCFLVAENIPIDELTEQVSCLSVSLKNDVTVPTDAYGKANLKASSFQPEGLLHQKTRSAEITEASPLEDSDLQILDSAFGAKTEKDSVIFLSDDEIDVNTVDVSHGLSSHSLIDGDEARRNSSIAATVTIGSEDQKLAVESNMERIRRPSSMVKEKPVQTKSKEKASDVQKQSFVENFSSKKDSSVPLRRAKNISDDTRSSKEGIKKASTNSEKIIKELIFDAKDDPWEFALKSARHHQSHLSKLNTGGPKRQVIQLNLPVENRVSQSNRLHSGQQRFKPLRLDDWFRPILEMDYFAAVGLAPAAVEKNQTAVGKLKEVPVYFQSPDDYVAVFRPLVLEELKAQLHNSFMEMACSDEMSCGSLSVMAVERVDDFHVVRCVHDDKDIEGSRSCVENDLILLTRQTFQNSFHDVHMVGKVFVLSILK